MNNITADYLRGRAERLEKFPLNALTTLDQAVAGVADGLRAVYEGEQPKAHAEQAFSAARGLLALPFVPIDDSDDEPPEPTDDDPNDPLDPLGGGYAWLTLSPERIENVRYE